MIEYNHCHANTFFNPDMLQSCNELRQKGGILILILESSQHRQLLFSVCVWKDIWFGSLGCYLGAWHTCFFHLRIQQCMTWRHLRKSVVIIPQTKQIQMLRRNCKIHSFMKPRLSVFQHHFSHKTGFPYWRIFLTKK